MAAELVFVCGNLYPYNLGGAEVFNYYLMRSMATDCKVTCINTKTDLKKDGIIHQKINASFLIALLFPFTVALSLIAKKDKNQTHVILSFSRSKWFYWVYYPILKKLFGIKYTIIIHGGGLTKWRFKAPFKWFFRNANHVIGISERIQNEYHARTGVDVKFMPPLIPFQLSDLSKLEARKRFDIDSQASVILQVGSLKKLKHPETAVHALSELKADKCIPENILLVFAGDGPQRPELEGLVKDLGLKNQVRFLGNVARHEIKDVYKLADYYVIASDFEGTPLSMLEAMANRIPVLASNAPGINTIIDHLENGLLFTIGNGKELGKLIENVVANTDLATTLTTGAARTLNVRYDHQKMLEQYKRMWNI
ncbi:glycosyltransferase family 4 protein [Flavobacteriales bacterium]|nr:glycosyltransferase family 4 protein [Flavobacteriales bacterium]